MQRGPNRWVPTNNPGTGRNSRLQPLATKTHNEDVTDKLLRDLTEALGPAYLIERELQGGGMSRVFVAREHALGREVVIKVLPPDLRRESIASASVARSSSRPGLPTRTSCHCSTP